MPTWSLIELLDCNDFFEKDKDYVSRMHDMFGGIPRRVLQFPEQDAHDDLELATKEEETGSDGPQLCTRHDGTSWQQLVGSINESPWIEAGRISFEV